MLFAALERTYYWEMLHDPMLSGSMNTEEFLDLCKKAGFAEREAQAAASQRAWQRLRKDLPV